ncbi:MAG TPA: Crp/Fnr family transcriptional regulator [Cyclobacteriaceae bacterium]|jgi:CRP/FNR family transcriptional regulator|nr:Crp/Fnr family transcriptional regulator [Cyclobacteriaceae bacterium]HNP06013.1 Crp/Fnr family transcriptional regulator [Cyclobacteriaceae bacterium]HRK55207.1 Crp/Fnr family transcriptional regulator [Cyclobacteriaceae bacterium]
METVPASTLISKNLLDRLIKEGTLKTFEPEAVIIDENDYIKSVPIVLSGSIKVLKIDEDGKEVLLYYIKPGESCVMSFLGATCNQTSKIKAIVEEKAEILMLPIHKSFELIKDNPAWLEFIFQLYNRRFEELLEVVNSVVFQHVDDRLWDLLKKKVKMLKTSELILTHQQLADELGTAREVVSRLLKQLEKNDQVKLSRNKVTVLVAV